MYFLRVIPTLKHYSDIVSDIPPGTVYGISILTFYLVFFLAYTLTFYLRFYLASILTYFLAYILAFFLTFCLTSILAFHPASFHAFILAFFLAFSLTFTSILSAFSVRRVFVADVRLRTLWSRACCSRPAGTTLIRGLLFGSGGDHCDLALAVEVGQGPLWS
jgi:hypothetical protein